MKTIASFLSSILAAGASKSEKITRILSNEKWNIVNYRHTTYSAFNIASEALGDNVGTFSFDGDGYATMTLNGTLSPTRPGSSPLTLDSTKLCKYEVFESNTRDFDAKVSVKFSSEFAIYGIRKESDHRMVFHDLFSLHSQYGNGYVVEMKLERTETPNTHLSIDRRKRIE